MNRILKALRLLNPQLINGGNLDCNEESNDSLPLYEDIKKSSASNDSFVGDQTH